jgi:UDP-N-acetylmuramoyl-tripeptide--D-alanyl-D-alanine ligase
LNNFWGVPLTMARTPASTEVAVFELGTNHPGEIAPLAELVQPNVALVLNVLPAHLAFFSDMAALTAEKLSIAKGLVPGGTLVMPDTLTPPDSSANCVFFGQSANADVQLAAFDECSHEAKIRVDGRTFAAHVPGGGEHRALTVTGVAACLHAASLDVGLVENLDEGLVPAGRGQTRVVAGIELVDDSYNANPVSMQAALISLAHAGGKRRFAIIGEMLELGEASDDYHRALAATCAGLDGVFCVGAGTRVLLEALPVSRRLGYAETVDEL